MRVIVVGGGIAGLTAAFRVHERAPRAEVWVLEQSSRVGGLIETERTSSGHLLELGPDSIVTFKPAAIQQAKAVGLGHALVEPVPNRRSFVAKGDTLLPMPDGLIGMAPGSAWTMMRSPLFSFWGKARMSLEPFVPGRRGSEDESVANFVTRRFGREVLDRLVDPLVGGVYRTPAASLSARAALPQLVQMERAHGSIARAMMNASRTPKLGAGAAPSAGMKGKSAMRGSGVAPMRTLQDGMASLPEHIAERLGDRVRRGVQVTRIDRGLKGFAVWVKHGGQEEMLTADRVIVAAPAWAAADLLKTVSSGASEALASITHTAVCSVTLAWERARVPHDLDGAGFVSAADSGAALSACTWSSQKWPGRAPAGDVLMRCYLRPERVQGLSDEACAELARAELASVLGVTDAPHLQRVHRLERALPQYTVGHHERVANIRAHLEGTGIYVAGNAYDGVGVPDCVKSAEQAAEACVNEFGAASGEWPESRRALAG